MKKMLAALLAIALFAGGCASLKLEPADFAWQAEEILDVDNNGMVSAARYATAFNVKPMLQKEFSADTMLAKTTKEVRVIRDKAGFYFIAAKKFKNVYVFTASEGALKIENTIAASQTEMADPKFNFNVKTNNYELWNGKDKFVVTKAGVTPLQGGTK